MSFKDPRDKHLYKRLQLQLRPFLMQYIGNIINSCVMFILKCSILICQCVSLFFLFSNCLLLLCHTVLHLTAKENILHFLCLISFKLNGKHLCLKVVVQTLFYNSVSYISKMTKPPTLEMRTTCRNSQMVTMAQEIKSRRACKPSLNSCNSPLHNYRCNFWTLNAALFK